jgi:elongation factor 1 alpha-like protein
LPTQFERSWNGYQGTTKEHALLARSLGVTQIIVAVNKLEKILWNKERYDYIEGLIRPYLVSVGFKQEDI